MFLNNFVALNEYNTCKPIAITIYCVNHKNSDPVRNWSSIGIICRLLKVLAKTVNELNVVKISMCS